MTQCYFIVSRHTTRIDFQSLLMQKVKCTKEEITTIRDALINKAVPVHKRFRIVFTLRNIEGPEAVDALAAGTAQVEKIT